MAQVWLHDDGVYLKIDSRWNQYMMTVIKIKNYPINSILLSAFHVYLFCFSQQCSEVDIAPCPATDNKIEAQNA